MPLKCPSTTVSLHTYRFIPCSGFTQGPAVSLHPPEAAMDISMCRRSASAAACLKADFHSGVIQISGLSTKSGAPISPSNICIPPIPTRCIHSRSAVMPASVTFPLIQCHQTKGLALSGGCRNSSTRLRGGSDWLVCPTRTAGIPTAQINPRIPQ